VNAGSYASGRQSSDGVKGYKSVTFRPTPPSSLPSDLTVKYSTSQQTNSSHFSSNSLFSEPTANGMNSSLSVICRKVLMLSRYVSSETVNRCSLTHANFVFINDLHVSHCRNISYRPTFSIYLQS